MYMYILIMCTRSALSWLSIGHNRLAGTAPESLSNLTTLKHLELQDNLLSGSFPREFYPPVLSLIDISSNQFTGFVPTGVFKSSLLQVYVVSSNCFSTRIPSAICSCKSLEYIIMDGIGTNSGYSIYNLINILQLLIF